MEEEDLDNPLVIKSFRNVTGKKRLKSRYNHHKSPQKGGDQKAKA